MNTKLNILTISSILLSGCGSVPLAQNAGGPPPRSLKPVSVRPTQMTVGSSIGLPEERARELDRVAKEGGEALAKAERLFAAGRSAEAEAQCAIVNGIWGTRGDRMNPGVAYLLGRIRMRDGRYAEAARIMGPNLDTTPLMRLDLALSLVRSGQAERARAAYEPGLITRFNSAFGDVQSHLPAISTPKDLEGALLWSKGEALRLFGRGDEAVDFFAAALDRFPKNALLGAELGFHAENAHRYAEAARGYAVVQASGDAKLKAETRSADLRVRELLKRPRNVGGK